MRRREGSSATYTDLQCEVARPPRMPVAGRTCVAHAPVRQSADWSSSIDPGQASITRPRIRPTTALTYAMRVTQNPYFCSAPLLATLWKHHLRAFFCSWIWRVWSATGTNEPRSESSFPLAETSPSTQPLRRPEFASAAQQIRLGRPQRPLSAQGANIGVGLLLPCAPENGENKLLWRWLSLTRSS